MTTTREGTRMPIDVDFSDLASDEEQLTINHLQALWGSTKGYVCLAFKSVADGGWDERFYSWPRQENEVFDAISERVDAYHCFYCPNVLRTKARTKGNAVKRQWVHLDQDKPVVDETVLDAYPATIIVESGSPNHTQRFWRISRGASRRSMSVDDHQQLCWGIGQTLGCGNDKVTDNDLFRLPGTLNHKKSPAVRVTVRKHTRQSHDVDELREAVKADDYVIDKAIATTPLEAVEPKKRPSTYLRSLLKDDSVGDGSDRGKKTYGVVSQCFEDGFSLEETLWLMGNYVPGLDKFEHEKKYVGGLPAQIMKCYAKRAAKEDAASPSASTDDRDLDNDVEAFWDERPVHAAIRDTARGLLASPWGTLGVVLMRASASMPTDIVLPRTVGREASLNGFVGLCGASGIGKGACEGAGKAAIDFGTSTHIENIGSGEGFAKTYAYRTNKGEYKIIRDSAILSAAEIDTMAAIAQRGGSTLLGEIRKLIMGERLGMANSDPTKRVPVEEHRYRAGVIVGIQPENSGVLLNDAKGGTPQRMLWLPANDPDAPDDEPDVPNRWAWSVPGFDPHELDEEELAELALDKERDREELRPLQIPPEAVELMKSTRRKQLRGEPLDDALDGHALLTRAKVAAWLMWIDGRTDAVTSDDWRLAGVVMRVSDQTRENVRALYRKHEWDLDVKGSKRRARLSVIGDDHTHKTNLDLVRRRLLKMLREGDDWISGSHLRGRLAANKRELFDEVIEELLETGEIVERTAKQGGKRYHLNA